MAVSTLFYLLCAAVAVLAAENSPDVVVKTGPIQFQNIPINKNITFRTAYCETLIPAEGQPSAENHPACDVHCRSLKEFGGGRCVAGICSCTLDEKSNLLKNGEEGHPTVRCEHILERGCSTHCQTLDYPTGGCIEGVCHCRQEKNVDIARHPAVRCEHLIPLQGQPSKNNHGFCARHCSTLGDHYKGGECVDGICQCEYVQLEDDEKTHPTVECESIVLEGKTSAENHAACKAHCLDIGEKYYSGKCVEGTCKCHLKRDIRSVH